MKKQRLVVGISGSSGAILGIRLLQALKPTPIETHLVITPSARLTIEQETNWSVPGVLSLANAHYDPLDLAAPIASGSFNTLGMAVVPCSIKSLSAVANSYTGDLLARAADVTLKEGRPLLLAVRETPLHAGHVRLMEIAAQAGAILFPPVPAFYTHPRSLDEMVDQMVGRMLQRLGIENDLVREWPGEQEEKTCYAEEIEASTATEGEIIQENEDLWTLPAMTLATSGADGVPHAAPVYFAADEERSTLYFFSAPGSQHSQDLSANPCAAAAIHPLVETWQEIRGLQLRGEVRALSRGADWDKAWERYLVKFPFASELKETVARSTFYAFHPQWVRLTDNRRGFGAKKEWTR